MRGLGNEVAKNLVLAGVNSMTILDHEILSKEDSFASFLAPTTNVGQNRAQASLERLKQRNPMVEITADEENLDVKEKAFFEKFDVVIVTNRSTQYSYFPGIHLYWRGNLGVLLALGRTNQKLFVPFVRLSVVLYTER